jgi:protein involved in polysaccharide export with SLBB domain
MIGRCTALAAVGFLTLLAGPGTSHAQSTQAVAATQTLRPGDVVRIGVWPNTELSGDFEVEDTGYVYLPLLGAMRVEGTSINQLREDLRRGFGEVMQNPVVSVTAMYRVTITGEVRAPGIQMITATSGLFDVIGMAGGFREEADSEKVRVVRRGQVIEFDALRALETGEGMDAIQLRSGDHIVVPRLRRRLTWGNALTVLQTVSLIAFSVQRIVR